MRLLKRFFGAKPTIEHPVFGKLTLRQGKKAPYWMHDSYSDSDLAISVETTDEDPPSDDEVAFYNRIINDLDAAFEMVAPHVVPEYEKWMKRQFPSNWREAFQFAGIGIPLRGNGDNPWDLTFELRADKKGFLFNCYFENGHVVHIGIDT
jgi:hypothetical protein